MIQMIDNLRERPQDEKRVIAGWIAVGVVVVLFLIWAFFFFRSIQHVPVPSLTASTTTAATNNDQELKLTPQQVDGAYLNGSTP